MVHLLRLFVRLGSYMAYTSWTTTTAALVVDCCHHVLQWLDENKSKYYKGPNGDYETTSLAYQKRVYET